MIGKGVVYTAIAGGKDLLRPVDPEFRMPGVAYVCFTDNLEIDPVGWRLKPLEERDTDPTRKARRAKINAKRYVGKYDWSLWIDGNMEFIASPAEFVRRHLVTGDFFGFMHPKRDCLFGEIDRCIELSKDSAELLRAQEAAYKKARFPSAYGLVETQVLLRRHNSPPVADAMDRWWRELKAWSRRDQVSLPYVLREGSGGFRYFEEGTVRGATKCGLFKRYKH